MGAATFLRKSFLIRWCLGSRESTRIREQTSGEDRGSSKGKGLGQGIPGKIKDHGGGEVGEGEEQSECSRSHTQQAPPQDTAGTSVFTVSEMRVNGGLLSRKPLQAGWDVTTPLTGSL